MGACFRDPVFHIQSQQYATVLDVMQNEILLKNGFNFANVLPNGRPDLNSLKLDDVFTCPLGSVPVKDQCGKKAVYVLYSI